VYGSSEDHQHGRQDEGERGEVAPPRPGRAARAEEKQGEGRTEPRLFYLPPRLELAHFVEPALDPPADDRRNSASTIN
jgi:hypothetical protein